MDNHLGEHEDIAGAKLIVCVCLEHDARWLCGRQWTSGC